MEDQLNADNLIRFYNKQDEAMQGALKAFWRGVAMSSHPAARVFAEALGRISHA